MANKRKVASDSDVESIPLVDSDVSDCVVAGAESQRSRGRSRTRRSPSSKRDREKVETCTKCMKKMTRGERYLKYRAHRECVLADRCLSFICTKNGAIKAAMQTMKVKDPDKYRMCLDSLQTRGEDGGRSSEARAQATEFLVELSRETTRSRKTGVVLLTKRQFIAYKVYRELYTKEKAAKLWASEKDDAYSEKNERGELVIAVRKPTEINEEDTAKVSRRFKSKKDVSKEEALATLSGPSAEVDRKQKKFLSSIWGSGSLSKSVASDVSDDENENVSSDAGSDMSLEPPPNKKDLSRHSHSKNDAEDAVATPKRSSKRSRSRSRGRGSTRSARSRKPRSESGSPLCDLDPAASKGQSHDSASRVGRHSPRPSKRARVFAANGAVALSSDHGDKSSAEFGKSSVAGMKPGDFVSKKRAFKLVAATKHASFTVPAWREHLQLPT